jgi:manganese-dependent inorganic pyrophosphatase
VTLLVVGGDNRVADRISYPQAGPGVYEMKDVLSRKKQVLPYLIELLQSM